MKLRIAGVVNDSIVDGAGLRLAVFTQGCSHGCIGCHNPQTHDFAGGREVDTAEVIAMMQDNPLLDGVTLSGGEPFCQCAACAEIARAAHAVKCNVWCYTGYTFEELRGGKAEWRELLEQVDVLVDGPFILEKRTLECRFRGSSNQRLIDVKRSLAENNVIEIE